MVLAVGVGAGEVKEEIGSEAHRDFERAQEAIEIFAIFDVVREIDIDRRGRPLTRIVVELVEGQRQHGAIACKNRSRTVAVMNVAIHDQRFFDQPLVLERTDGDGNIVDGAETFAVRRKSMMKTSADVEADAVAQRVAGSQGGPAGSQPKSLHHFARIGDLKLDDFGVAQRSSFQAAHPAGIVDTEDIVIGNRLRLHKVGRFSEALLEQAIVNQPVLARGKYSWPRLRS